MPVSRNQPLVRGAVAATFYEYILTIFPVAIYVGLEAYAHEHPDFFIESPEWAIATIFLNFQCLALYLRNFNESGREFSYPVFGLVSLFSLGVVIVASINAMQSLGHTEVRPNYVYLRLGLLILSSAMFLLFVTAAKYGKAVSETMKRGK